MTRPGRGAGDGGTPGGSGGGSGGSGSSRGAGAPGGSGGAGKPANGFTRPGGSGSVGRPDTAPGALPGGSPAPAPDGGAPADPDPVDLAASAVPATPAAPAASAVPATPAAPAASAVPAAPVTPAVSAVLADDGAPPVTPSDAPAEAPAGAPAPAETRGPGRTRAALALLASTQLLLIMDTAIINVALPSIGDDLGAGSAGLSWVANAYLITFGGLLLLGGRAADLLGHRRLYLTGLALLTVASVAGALAGGPGLLIAARAAQGVGAALAAAAAFALLLNLFPPGPGRHTALGAFAAMGGLGGVLGTVLGGVLTDALGWRSTFWLNVFVGLVLGGAALRLLDRGGRRAANGFDLGGACTATAGLGLVAYALVGAAEAGWTGTRTLVAGGAGLLLLAVFALLESRIAHPLVPPAVLRRPALRNANVLSALGQMALFPMFFLVSLYLQTVLDQSPLVGGLGLLPLSLVVVAVAPQSGRLIARIGLRATMTLGFGLLASGLVWLALALSADGTFFTTVFAPSLVIGVALPLVMVTTNVAATADAAPEETGLASGLVNTSQQFGSVLGLAVLVAVAAVGNGAGAAGRTSGFTAALLVGAGFAALAVLLSVRMRPPAPLPGHGPAPAPGPRTGPATGTGSVARQDRVGGAVE
ncbi:MFS transporter [Streptomyces sp. NPDC020965]|uniref:MFS transporter n=1 Tax=Streptomyces sp. NPDC020965 TaxID=3365105 RepID=UPI0037ADB581